MTLHYRDALDALQAVLDLHQPMRMSDGSQSCEQCSYPPDAIDYPCPTVEAIQAAIGIELTADYLPLIEHRLARASRDLEETLL